MPEKETRKRAAADKKAGRAASTQAGEYVREEMHHIREGRHGARNAKQAIAIGLSQARRDGVDLKPPKKGMATEATRKKAEQDRAKAHQHSKPSPKRSKAATQALKREPKSAASHASLSKHAKQAAAKRRSAEK
jgi:hypothetical protein